MPATLGGLQQVDGGCVVWAARMMVVCWLFGVESQILGMEWGSSSEGADTAASTELTTVTKSKQRSSRPRTVLAEVIVCSRRVDLPKLRTS
jgi:hypothetical protein